MPNDLKATMPSAAFPHLPPVLPRVRTLGELFMNIADLPANVASVVVNSIVIDSREVQPGSLFIAMKGQHSDGRDYVEQAVKKGAQAVVFEEGGSYPAGLGVPVLVKRNPRGLIGPLAECFYDTRAFPLRIAAVTGTNGKTSVAWYARQMLSRFESACSIGTLGVHMTLRNGRKTEDKTWPLSLTTPEAHHLQHILRASIEHNCEAVVMEASSVGIDQERLAGTPLSAVAFTNITEGEHLDYHEDFDSYRQAKYRLVQHFHPDIPFKPVVTATEMPGLQNHLVDRSGGIPTISVPDMLSFGRAKNKFNATIKKETARGFTIQARFKGDQGELKEKVIVPVMGQFNLSNALIAWWLAYHLNPEVPLAAMEHITPPPGRLNRVEAADGRVVMIDYAHTPDALKNVLEALRPVCKGKLICVFGCGGDRDPAKRPLMGRIAEELADRVVVTSDNPRSEDPEVILEEIVAGMKQPGEAIRLADRNEAILLAAGEAKPGDMVLIAGKGNETVQIIGGERLHHSDFEAVKEAFGELAE